MAVQCIYCAMNEMNAAGRTTGIELQTSLVFI